jgi:hypothetical protein
MTSEYTFLQARGSSRFALVTVDSDESAEWSLSFGPAIALTVPWCMESVRAGIDGARRHCQRAGGRPWRVTVAGVQVTPADTTEDALWCAAAIAAWKPWGQYEGSEELAFDGQRWSVSFLGALDVPLRIDTRIRG